LAWGFGRYKFQHEPIFYCHVAGQSDAWYGDKTQSTLWQEKMKFYTTFLASMFHSVRFGINEAHGKGVALQFNYLIEAGGIVVNTDGTFSVDESKFEAGVTRLTGDLLTLEAEGSYVKAKSMLDKYSIIAPSMRRALDKLSSIPVDIEPSYPLATAR
jgi:hypothetical protein